MPSADDVLTVFTASIEGERGSTVLRVPERELELGDLNAGETYRVALLPRSGERSVAQSTPERRLEVSTAADPPVDVGEELEVEIEGIGEKGDGIARVGDGYIIFVPDTAVGDRVTVEVGKTLENYGFGEVITPEPVSG